MLILSAVVSACVNLQTVPIPDLNERISDKEKSRIYVIRPEQGFLGMLGNQVLQEVFENNQSIGQLPSGKYLVWETLPRKITITSHNSKYSTSLARSGRSITIDTKPGEVYFLAVAIGNDGFFLSQVSESDGRKLLTESAPMGK